MDGRREPNHGAPDPLLLGQRVDQIGRQRPLGEGGRVPFRLVGLGAERAGGETQRAGRDDEGLAGARERLAQGCNGRAVRRAAGGEVGEVVDEG